MNILYIDVSMTERYDCGDDSWTHGPYLLTQLRYQTWGEFTFANLDAADIMSRMHRRTHGIDNVDGDESILTWEVRDDMPVDYDADTDAPIYMTNLYMAVEA